MLQVKGAPCQNLPDNGSDWLQIWVCSLPRCWHPLNITKTQTAFDQSCVPISTPETEVWVGSSVSCLSPRKGFCYTRALSEVQCTLRFPCVWHTWQPCEPSQQPLSYSTGINSCRASSTFTLTRTTYRANILCENNKPHGKPYFSAPCEIFP